MSQARGGGSLVSFETGNVALSKAFSEHLKLFKVTNLTQLLSMAELSMAVLSMAVLSMHGSMPSVCFWFHLVAMPCYAHHGPCALR